MPSRTRVYNAVEAETGETQDSNRESGDSGSQMCALEMEMASRLLHGDSKADYANRDGFLNAKSGDSTEVSVHASLPRKRLSPIEGDNLYKLRERKFILEDKKHLCAWALGTALFGILLMIIHAEMCPKMYEPGSSYAFIINCSISLSTVFLLVLIIAFHYKDVRLFVIDHNQVDWRIAMTRQRVLAITVELLVCAIHPVGAYWEVGIPVPKSRVPPQANISSSSTSASSAPLCVSHLGGSALLDVELLLSALMFLRLYLVHRAILLHSKVLLSASYRSIGSLNNINFTFRFVLKVLMDKHPARTLLVFILLFWLSTSWMLALCESPGSVNRNINKVTNVAHNDNALGFAMSGGERLREFVQLENPRADFTRQTLAVTGHMHQALWLIAITFLTVGYGDIAPSTSCGRAVCLFAGVMGVACTAMLVAVVTKKLALNKGEKHVHFFMLDIQIAKRIRHAAANVLRECWLLHRSNLSKGNNGERRRHQRYLLEAIRVFRHLRLKQRKLRDYASEMVDLPKMQMMMCDLTTSWNNSYRELEQRIRSMEQKLDEINRCFQQTSELLSQALQLRDQEIRQI